MVLICNNNNMSHTATVFYCMILTFYSAKYSKSEDSLYEWGQERVKCGAGWRQESFMQWPPLSTWKDPMISIAYEDLQMICEKCQHSYQKSNSTCSVHSSRTYCSTTTPYMQLLHTHNFVHHKELRSSGLLCSEVVVISYWHFETTYESHPQDSRMDNY
jgi:hypothetical protein